MMTKKLDWFEEGVLAARTMLKAYAMKLYRNVDAAEDAVQDTICRALDNRDKFEKGTNLDAWLSVIMLNRFKQARRRSRSKLGDIVQEDRVLFTDDPHYADHVPATSNPEADLISGERIVDIMRMPDAWFDVVWRIGVGFTYEDTAQALGLPVGTVKSRVSRARAFLAAA